MDRGESIFFHHALRNQDRVLEVVSVPRHECDAHILTKSQFAGVDRRSVCKNVAPADFIPFAHQRPLTDAGILIRARVLGEIVDINPRLTSISLIVIYSHDDASCIDTFDNPATLGYHADT